MQNKIAQYQIVIPPPSEFAAAVGGNSSVVLLGLLRRAVIQDMKLRALHIASSKLGHADLEASLAGILLRPPSPAAWWLNTTELSAWMDTALAWLDPATRAQAHIQLGHFEQNDAPTACTALTQKLDSTSSYFTEDMAIRTGDALSVLDTTSWAANLLAPDVAWLPRVTGDRTVVASERSVSAQVLLRKFLPWISADRAAFTPRIVPVTMHEGRLLSWTSSSLLGTIFVTDHPDIGLLAEQLVHEISHTRLFLVQMIDDLLVEDFPNQSWTDARFYSPWRREPRPLNGILHGVFVFDAIAQFWFNVLTTSDALPELKLTGRRRLGQLVGQLAGGVESLARHGRFTASGQAVFNRLAERLHSVFLPFSADLQLVHERVLDLDAVTDISESLSVADSLHLHALRWQREHGHRVV